MGLRKSIHRMIERHRIQKRINAARYVHLMFNDKFNKPFVDFLNRHFDSSEHLVLCKRWFSEYPFPTGPNVIAVATFRGFDFSAPTLRQVICHSLFDGEVVDLLYDNRQWLEKSVWIVWGGDLYQAPMDKQNDYVRRNIGLVAATFDRKVISERYGVDNVVPIIIPCPTTIKQVELRAREINRGVVVQINNSCDRSTMEAMECLATLGLDTIRVRTVLSYGDMQYCEKIRRRGVELFGSRFEPLEENLLPKDYVEWFSSNDVLIMNQPRQQGMGNVQLAFAMGVKVFLRNDVTTYDWCRDQGYRVFDTLHLTGMEITASTREDALHNRRIALRFADENICKNLWGALFK